MMYSLLQVFEQASTAVGRPLAVNGDGGRLEISAPLAPRP